MLYRLFKMFHFSLGPLLYHFENMANELSVELSYEDIRAAMVNLGFHIEVSLILIRIHE